MYVLPEARLDAVGEATYSSSAAARTTLARVWSLTFGSPRSARETVAVDTPAALATSSIRLTDPPVRICSTGSPLQAASQQSADEEALQAEEDHQRDHHRHEGPRRQQVPRAAPG